ncbi:hypothetical protein [Mesorhizobium sp. 128a]
MHKDLHRSASAAHYQMERQGRALEPFLVCHEIVEKALLDELRLHYLHAHQIASRIARGRRQSGWPELATTIKAFI